MEYLTEEFKKMLLEIFELNENVECIDVHFHRSGASVISPRFKKDEKIQNKNNGRPEGKIHSIPERISGTEQP